MVTIFEFNWYWQGGFTEDEQKYYKEYRLSEKGKYVWKQIDRLRFIAETCAPNMMYPGALMNLVALRLLIIFLPMYL